MPSELREIEVDEVSLVDRPATGKRFVLFKRGPRPERGPGAGEEEANKCSNGPTLHDIEKRLRDLADIRERMDSAAELLKRLQDEAAGVRGRVEALEQGHPARQSEEAAPRSGGLWSGLL
ncbi:MAG TPA: hypothetical protein VGM37_12415 [Armatimonadota bacterium]|jgi:ABC-type Fe3+-hydroxamate transport system substrate-binding protein